MNIIKKILKIIVGIVLLLAIIWLCEYLVGYIQIEHQREKYYQIKEQQLSDEVLLPYVLYLQEENKNNVFDMESIAALTKKTYKEYTYSAVRCGGRLYFIFFDDKGEIEVYIKYPLNLFKLQDYYHEITKNGASWERIIKWDETALLYDIDENIAVSEHLLENGDMLLIEYDKSNNHIIKLEVYPELGKEYLDVIKGIIKEL